MAMARCLIGLSLGALARGKLLTADSWDAETAGKTVFVKFYIPGCDQCKKMKPAWDKLMKNWNKGKRATFSLVADVNCEDSRTFCEKVGIQGVPTVKWGDPNALQDYQGEKSYDDLKKFAFDKLKPTCSAFNIDLCDDDTKAKIAELEALPIDDLAKRVADKQAEIQAAEDEFEWGKKRVEDEYKQLQTKLEDAQEDVKESGLHFMQAVALEKRRGR